MKNPVKAAGLVMFSAGKVHRKASWTQAPNNDAGELSILVVSIRSKGGKGYFASPDLPIFLTVIYSMIFRTSCYQKCFPSKFWKRYDLGYLCVCVCFIVCVCVGGGYFGIFLRQNVIKIPFK